MLSLSLLGSPQVRLLGNPPAAYRRGHALRGLGIDSSGNNGLPYCALVPRGDPYRTNPSNPCTDNSGDDTTIGASTDPITATASTTTSTSTSSSAAGVPWYSSLATGITKGLFTTTPLPGQLPVAAPWYTTPIGLIAILGVGIGGYMLLKSPPSRSSSVAGLFGYKTRRRSKRRYS